MANLRLRRATCGAVSHRRPTAAVVAVALLLAGCAAGEVPAAPADDAELVSGREIYANNCVNCHGSAGGGGVGSKLDQGRVVERYPDPAEQFAVISEGVRAMPGFGPKLTEAEIDAVVRYTREIIAGL